MNTSRSVIYRLDHPNPLQRAFAWGAFREMMVRTRERKSWQEQLSAMEPDALAGRRFRDHCRTGENAERHAKAKKEREAIRSTVNTERERLSREYKKAGRTEHGTLIDAMREIARRNGYSVNYVRKRYYSK